MVLFEGRWYMVVILSIVRVYGMVLEYRERKIVRVYGIENGGYGLGMSDGMWWYYIKNSEDIL